MQSFFIRMNNVIQRTVRKFVRLQWFKLEGIKYVQPNFICFPEKWQKNHACIAIDVGCGKEADFSLMLIECFGFTVFAVDPTMKHQAALASLCDKYGSLHHLSCAVSVHDGIQTFFESRINESGSILSDHINIVNDKIISYEVKSLSLLSLLAQLGINSADIIKLDIEGAEYALLDSVSKNDLLPFGQIFVEFHHHTVHRYCEADTIRLVNKIRDFGFRAFSLDDCNYLFVRSETISK